MAAEVQRTIGYWKEFFKGDKKKMMLLTAFIHEKKLTTASKYTLKELEDGMTLLGNRCLHDSDKCLFNTRRDM
jgi:hypothetical protein